MRRLLVVLLFAAGIRADVTPQSIAALVTSSDDALLPAQLTDGLRSPAPLVRAAAARVTAVRGLTALLPIVRENVSTESDPTAARELIRALALLGTPDDLTLAAKSSARFPAAMDNALAIAAARRGGASALDAYVTTVRNTRMNNVTEFFRVALWGHPELIPLTGSKLLSIGDGNGWRGILATLAESEASMNGPVMTASLTSSSEEIRSASVWSLVRGYGVDPESMHELVKAAIVKPRAELSSNREDFGFEILQRMLGGEKKDDPRWLKFVETDEADQLLGSNQDVLQWLTDEEYRIRYTRCEVQVRECAIPEKRAERSGRKIPSQRVSTPAFNLPEVLPAGLADAVMSSTKCRDAWLGVATATVDRAGRTTALDLDKVSTGNACKKAIDMLLRLSFATNTSLRSGFTGPVLLVRAPRRSLCLDEEVPSHDSMPTLLRVGGDVIPPKVKKRVEPQFPASARTAMGSGANVLVIAESVVSKEGCIRSIRLLAQSPFPEINGAAVAALSQWTFTPGYLEGKPVDVIFNLTINFKVN